MVAADAVGSIPTAGEKTLFSIDVSSVLGEDFAHIVNDFMRMVCIQVAVQLLVVSSGGEFFTAQFFMILMYVAIGVMLYWAVIRKIVAFR